MKLKKVIGLCLVSLWLSSCTISHQITVTNNPVGSKKGVAKGSNFSKDLDITYAKAAENGGIKKIGTTETKVTQILFVVKYKTVVTGE